MHKVSVIVPIYNSEKYLCRCIDSILAQSYSNFELVLINDGSKDSSGSICDEYAKIDTRVKVYHISNDGANNARYKGLQESQGEYVIFVDSDDYISYNYIDVLYNEICSSNVSIVIHSEYENLHHVCKYKYMVDMLKSRISMRMYNKMYCRKLLESGFKILSKELQMGEDLVQSLIIANLCPYVKYFKNSDIKYHYTDNVTSVSHMFNYSYSYEKKYYNVLEKLINFNEVNVRKALLQSKLNGLSLIILAGNDVDYNDEYYISCKKEYNRLNLKSPEAWLLFHIRNKYICRIIIYYKRKIVHILQKMRNK